MAAPAMQEGSSRASATPTPKGAWKITFLLFLFMVVNFADKIVVGLAGVPIMTELDLNAEQFGLLGSSFFLLFSIAAIVVGFVVNRVPTRWVLLVLALIWALAQFPMVGTIGFTTLLVCRIILGAGEGPAASVAVHAVYKWFPDEKRAMPTAILSQGSAFGVILAVPALNWVIVNHGWHYAFGALGQFNAALDHSAPALLRSRVLARHLGHSRLATYQLTLEPWGPFATPTDAHVQQALYERLQPGDTVCLRLHDGAFGMAWFTAAACR